MDNRKKCVLIVDDERAAREAVALVLLANGCTILTAENGKEAMEVIETGRMLKRSIDLLILDLQMPKMDGRDVLRELARMGLHIPVIVVSGWVTAEGLMDTGYQIHAVLAKPFEVDELTSMLSDVLNAPFSIQPAKKKTS